MYVLYKITDREGLPLFRDQICFGGCFVQGGNSPNSSKVLNNVSWYVPKSCGWSNFSAKQRFVACEETIDEYQLSKQWFRCLDLGSAAGKSFLNSLLDRLRIESKTIGEFLPWSVHCKKRDYHPGAFLNILGNFSEKSEFGLNIRKRPE
jgi:hypothetical protein